MSPVVVVCAVSEVLQRTCPPPPINRGEEEIRGVIIVVQAATEPARTALFPTLQGVAQHVEGGIVVRVPKTAINRTLQGVAQHHDGGVVRVLQGKGPDAIPLGTSCPDPYIEDQARVWVPVHR